MGSRTGQPRRRLGIATQVFIGLGAGILVGLFFGEEVAFLQLGGDIFIALLQVTVIPYVVVALITSLGRLTLDEAKHLGLKAGGVLLLLWIIGLAVVLSSPLAFPNWASASFFSTSQIQEPAAVDFLKLYIPSNIFASLAFAIVPAVVVFSILFGVALIGVKNKERFVGLLSTVGDTLMTMTAFIGRLAPYGVFAITAAAAGTIDIGDLARLQVYIVTYVSMALILSLWIIPGLIAALTPLSYTSVVRAFRGPLITAFATANVLIVLPVLAADAKRLVAETDGQDGEPSEQEESAIDILIPAAFPFPNLGLVLSLMFVLFGGWFVGATVAASDYLLIAGAGLASLFGSTILALPFLFDLLRLPADLFQVFITVDVIGARFGTLLAGMHIIAIALIGAYAMEGALQVRAGRLVRFALVSVAMVLAVLVGIRAFYTYVFVAPFTKDQVLAGLSFLEAPQPHRVYREVPPETPRRSPATLARIQETGVLRACYQRSDYPSSFFNRDGDLVGFDIEMTHRFASRLDARVDFIPVDSIPDAEASLDKGTCDIFMSLLPIVPEMTLSFAMTVPVIDGPIGMIMTDYRRREFESWEAIAGAGDIRIATTDNRATPRFLDRMLPDAQQVILQDNAALDALLTEDPPRFDAILMAAEEGAAWTIRYPRLNLTIPTPILMIPLGYALARDSDPALLTFFNAWLDNAQGYGTVDALYRYWMLGELDSTREPRWSIARDVLGWLD
jgi:Na+/H+-dicarboxylate symporter